MPKVVLVMGDDVSTDVIYPGRYMATVLPSETPAYAFADHAEINFKLKKKEIPQSSIIMAGHNFGCGSSREQAVSCLKGYELTIVAKSIGRIFLQNAVNLGLRVVVCPTIEGEEGNELEIQDRQIYNRTREKLYPITPMPKARQEIMEAGGLIAFVKKKLVEEN
jgi:3-isopropylmalate/(R)-2-methylmalate dehydratase small subunit